MVTFDILVAVFKFNGFVVIYVEGSKTDDFLMVPFQKPTVIGTK